MVERVIRDIPQVVAFVQPLFFRTFLKLLITFSCKCTQYGSLYMNHVNHAKNKVSSG
jgi:hypothetical protein